MKALIGAFNQEKALVGAFSVIVQPVVEPMDRFAALLVTVLLRVYDHPSCSSSDHVSTSQHRTLDTWLLAQTTDKTIIHNLYNYLHLQFTIWDQNEGRYIQIYLWSDITSDIWCIVFCTNANLLWSPVDIGLQYN